jgi:hypothetical protein
MRDTEKRAKSMKKLPEVQELFNRYDRVILAFPGCFTEAQLVLAVNLV